jgi:prevent-host-death family protein
MAKTVTVAQAKNQFSDLLNQVLYRHERVLITKRGKPVGVLVSARDLKKLEDAENRELLKRVRALEKKTKKFIPLEQFVRDYEQKWGVDLRQVEPEEF